MRAHRKILRSKTLGKFFVIRLMVGIIYVLPVSHDEICAIFPALNTSAVEHKQSHVESHIDSFN